VARALSRFGRIDILVNDAGILRVTPLIDTTANEWDKVMAVNARGAFLCSKHVARHMVAQNRGKIVNISSNAGKAAFPNEPSYIASKHAIIGLTKSMALDLAPFRINVNAICPGEVDTGMYRAYIRREAQLTKRTDEEVLGEAIHSIPLGRLAEPKEIANIAVFLCSDDADYVTGQAINVDGGSVLSK
jgi:3-oxoacyl-[acyl-carrier protein] reductase